MSEKKLSANEGIKTRSNFLRGTITDGLQNEITGALAADDTQVTKFHGFYQQDDRDIRAERKEQKLEPLHSFMLRARVPGGVCTPAQWLTINNIADELTMSGSIRLTTRQTFQYHGILKGDIRPVIQGLHSVLLDSIAACGDVNRNVLATTNPIESSLHKAVYQWAVRISEHLLPKTRAYHEIWIDNEKVVSSEPEDEPIYGPTYLPRKFKTAVVVPPHNDVDVYTNDLGFIAIAENGVLTGFNVTAGGGMGATHGEPDTYPRLASDLGFIKPDDTLKVAEAILTTQRDFGNRESRKHARLKYTIDRMGIDTFRKEVEARAGVTFQPVVPVTFTQQGDRLGWVAGEDGKHHLTLFIENGRILDFPGRSLKTGLLEIAKVHKGDFRMTANQNIIVAGVAPDDRKQIEDIARAHGLYGRELTVLRENSMACVALPTCALAMAEAERYLPDLITHYEALQVKHGIEKDAIVVRMTGCPNGCGRPYVAEIGFVGKAPGRYNMHIGGNGLGTRLNTLYKENITEATILEETDALFSRYASERVAGERFGDFVHRAGIVGA
jgi:sulfite reductase (NADPH) hemoprotein beta-component